MNNPINVLCILGPTATGKTDLALYAAEKYKGEIINVDSAQVYKHMDIGTAKLDLETRSEIPHHLFDIREPFDTYSAADFVTDSSKLISEIHARQKLPILAGGTMMYFKALFDGLADLPAANEDFRKALAKRAETEGWQSLHVDLQKVDPVSAARIEPTDPQRIQRALEVFHLSGKPLSVLHAEGQRVQNQEFNFVKMALMPSNRAHLHARIEKRLYNMMSEGFLEEVQDLVRMNDFSREWPSMRAVGYRQLLSFIFDGETLEGAVQKSIFATRQLAKRQLTWLRKMPDLTVIDPYTDNVPVVVEKHLRELNAVNFN